MNIIDKISLGLIHAKGGGGGGGGTGAVSYPAYMEAFHADIINNTGADTMTSSLVDIMNIAIGGSPYTGEVAYDPSVPVAAMLASVDDLDTLVTLLSSGTTLDTLISNVLDQTRIDANVLAYTNDLGDRLTSEVLPRFESGMRDINAVVSSAFAIGKAVIESSQTRQVAKYSAELNMKAFGDDAIKVIGLKLEYQKMLTHLTVEANRLKVVASKEEVDTNLEIAEGDAGWDLGVFQHGGNLLASIGGGTVNTEKNKKSQASSAIGGAMTGAVSGAQVGSAIPGIGTGIGAGIGAVLGAASAFL